MSGQRQIDSTATVLAGSLGRQTAVGAHTYVAHGAEVGVQCRIGRHCVICNGVTIGDRVTLEDYVSIPSGVTVQEGAFLGSHVAFATAGDPYAAGAQRTLIAQGARIGVNATLLCGITVGRHAQIEPGCIVTRDVPDHARLSARAAELAGWACVCGRPLDLPTSGDRHATCTCGRSYRLLDDQLTQYRQLGE